MSYKILDKVLANRVGLIISLVSLQTCCAILSVYDCKREEQRMTNQGTLSGFVRRGACCTSALCVSPPQDGNVPIQMVALAWPLWSQGYSKRPRVNPFQQYMWFCWPDGYFRSAQIFVNSFRWSSDWLSLRYTLTETRRPRPRASKWFPQARQ
jgi:hypothetical protein